jgi:hypothetical protein
MEQCQFCLETYDKKKTLILCCNHKFHKKCILNWFENCDSFAGCPICRKENIKENKGEIIIDKDIFESNRKNVGKKNTELYELKQISEDLQKETLNLQNTINMLEEDCFYYKEYVIKLGNELHMLDFTVIEQKRNELKLKEENRNLKEENRNLKEENRNLKEENRNLKEENNKTIKRKSTEKELDLELKKLKRKVEIINTKKQKEIKNKWIIIVNKIC